MKQKKIAYIKKHVYKEREREREREREKTTTTTTHVEIGKEKTYIIIYMKREVQCMS